MSNTTLTVEERSEILQAEIAHHVRKGYRVMSQTNTTAQLVKPKRFSLIWAALWFLFFGVGILIYFVYYIAKRDDQVYLEVDPEGRVRRR